MTVLIRTALLLTLALPVTVPLAAKAEEDFPPETIGLLDDNGDDAISPNEIDGFIPRIHAAMDTNEDGRLDASEAAVALTPEQIAAVDTNGDGVLSRDELGTVIRADFAAADRDGNGLID